ncbi:flippase-like domain-containing protein [Candidatus Saccharibacteria bacterium]|nr:flippase-like domain-containing protein [Candidatus Saccharibacteria bacterium]
MLKNRLAYFLINVFFVVVALCFVNYSGLLSARIEWPNILVIMGLFLLIHVARFIRMYFILLEDLIRPTRFLQLYVKTTFVSTLIPFKIGELFKMYCYGVETQSAMKGVMAVAIEKFFDAMVLCMFMVPYALSEGALTPLLVILLLFAVLMIVFYFSFGGTYKYLNSFLVCRGGGRKTIVFLRVLEGIKRAYDGAKRTLSGRFVLLLFLSVLAWGLEGLLLSVLNSGNLFDFGAATSYVSDAFFGVNNASFEQYVYLCAIVFFLIMIIIYGRKYLIKRRRDDKIGGRI